jgi:hypothetical protein
MNARKDVAAWPVAISKSLDLSSVFAVDQPNALCRQEHAQRILANGSYEVLHERIRMKMREAQAQVHDVRDAGGPSDVDEILAVLEHCHRVPREQKQSVNALESRCIGIGSFEIKTSQLCVRGERTPTRCIGIKRCVCWRPIDGQVKTAPPCGTPSPAAR